MNTSFVVSNKAPAVTAPLLGALNPKECSIARSRLGETFFSHGDLV